MKVRYWAEVEIDPQPVDQAWIGLVLAWLQTWRFTQAQADHLIAIIRSQTL